MGLKASRPANYKTFFSALALILVVSPFLSPRSLAHLPGENNPKNPAAQAGTHPTSVPGATLTLRVYNYAGLDSASLAASEKVASTILQKVGVEATWLDCPTSKANVRAYPACDSQMGPADLVLRILPRHMALKLRRSNDSLGSAQTCPETEPACELNVFYHRIDELAASGYRADRILGHVIAHEIAHILLGPRHSDDGILRGEWSSSDLQRISLGIQLDFSNDQSRRLRLAILRRIIPPIQQATTQANLIARESQ